jgi:hypothetical protein
MIGINVILNCQITCSICQEDGDGDGLEVIVLIVSHKACGGPFASRLDCTSAPLMIATRIDYNFFCEKRNFVPEVELSARSGCTEALLVGSESQERRQLFQERVWQLPQLAQPCMLEVGICVLCSSSSSVQHLHQSPVHGRSSVFVRIFS